MKRSIKIAVLSLVIITIIVIVLAVLLLGSSPQLGTGKISITDVSLDWGYDEGMWSTGYYVKEFNVKIKNVGYTDIQGDLLVWAEIDGENPEESWGPSFIHVTLGLDAGETRTISDGSGWWGWRIPPGEYTLTLQVKRGSMPGHEGELLGERKMVIQVP